MNDELIEFSFVASDSSSRIQSTPSASRLQLEIRSRRCTEEGDVLFGVSFDRRDGRMNDNLAKYKLFRKTRGEKRDQQDGVYDSCETKSTTGSGKSRQLKKRDRFS